MDKVIKYEHIEVTEGGRTWVGGHRIRVEHIFWYMESGMSVDEIVENFTLTHGEVYAALAYYYDHREEIEARIAKEEEKLSTYPNIDEILNNK